jgi:hypothetical protein
MYYLTEEDLRVFQRGDVIWVIVHAFGEELKSEGQIGKGEYTWAKRGGVITMTPTAGGTVYTHEDANHKLLSGRYRWSDETGDNYLTANLELSRGDTSVYRCAVAPQKFRSRTPPALVEKVEDATAKQIATPVAPANELSEAARIRMTGMTLAVGYQLYTGTETERTKLMVNTCATIARQYGIATDVVHAAYGPIVDETRGLLEQIIGKVVKTKPEGRAMRDALDGVAEFWNPMWLWLLMGFALSWTAWCLDNTSPLITWAAVILPVSMVVRSVFGYLVQFYRNAANRRAYDRSLHSCTR